MALMLTTVGHVLLTGAGHPAIAAAAAAPGLWVATDGDDGDAGTEAAPFATVQAALAAASPGDTINVKAGSYNAQYTTITSGGTAGNPITILSVDGRAAAKFYPDVGQPNTEIFRIEGVTDVIIDGLEIHGALSREAVHITETGASVWCERITVQNCDIYPQQHDGLKASKGIDLVIHNNQFFADQTEGQHEQLLDCVGVLGLTITNNELSGLLIGASGTAAMQVKGGSENVLIRHNRFFDNGYWDLNVGGSTSEGDMDDLPDALAGKYEAKTVTVEGNEFAVGAGSYALRILAGHEITLTGNWFRAGGSGNAGRLAMIDSPATPEGTHSLAWPTGNVYFNGTNTFLVDDPPGWLQYGSGTPTVNGTVIDNSAVDPNGGAVTYGLTA